MYSKNVLFYGKDEPLPERIALRAGPLSLFYEEGDLRYIKYGSHEVIRRIYVAVRDRNWGTVTPVLSNIQMEIGGESFRISYDVENKQGEIDFPWKGVITGDADGRIAFSMDGYARTTFWRNRIGFCVLQPAAAAGADCLVEHIDGTGERASLPVVIVADQPVKPFGDMKMLAHQVQPGLWAEMRFFGDIFEMEDQRNWTDASYKIFCTPLRLPYPVEIAAGTRVSQSVELSLRDERGASAQGIASTTPGPLPITYHIDQGKPAQRLPDIGLGSASHDLPLSDSEIERLRALHLNHLRVDLLLSDPSCAARLQRAAQEAGALGVSLEVALLISENGEAELAELRRILDQVKPPVDLWLVYPVKEQFKGGSPTRQVVTQARKTLQDYNTKAHFAAGTNTDYIFMLRTPPPVEMLDRITFAITPQVHAFDNSSLVETMEAQGAAVASARSLPGGLPVVVSPVTFKMRFNAYASAPPAPLAPGELPPQVDVRQMSLFAAGWTAGSIKYLAENGAQRVTYYETTGWRGVMETENGSPLPEKFQSLAGSVFPMYHVFADVGEYRGGVVIPSHSSDPLRVDGLVVQRDNQTRLILANLSAESLTVELHDLPPNLAVRQIDETNAIEAMQQPEAFRAGPGGRMQAAEGGLSIALKPYAVVCLDFQGS